MFNVLELHTPSTLPQTAPGVFNLFNLPEIISLLPPPSTPRHIPMSHLMRAHSDESVSLEECVNTYALYYEIENFRKLVTQKEYEAITAVYICFMHIVLLLEDVKENAESKTKSNIHCIQTLQHKIDRRMMVSTFFESAYTTSAVHFYGQVEEPYVNSSTDSVYGQLERIDLWIEQNMELQELRNNIMVTELDNTLTETMCLFEKISHVLVSLLNLWIVILRDEISSRRSQSLKDTLREVNFFRDVHPLSFDPLYHVSIVIGHRFFSDLKRICDRNSRKNMHLFEAVHKQWTGMPKPLQQALLTTSLPLHDNIEHSVQKFTDKLQYMMVPKDFSSLSRLIALSQGSLLIGKNLDIRKFILPLHEYTRSHFSRMLPIYSHLATIRNTTNIPSMSELRYIPEVSCLPDPEIVELPKGLNPKHMFKYRKTINCIYLPHIPLLTPIINDDNFKTSDMKVWEDMPLIKLLDGIYFMINDIELGNMMYLKNIKVYQKYLNYTISILSQLYSGGDEIGNRDDNGYNDGDGHSGLRVGDSGESGSRNKVAVVEVDNEGVIGSGNVTKNVKYVVGKDVKYAVGKVWWGTGIENVEGGREEMRRNGGQFDAGDSSCVTNETNAIVNRGGGNEGGNGSSEDDGDEHGRFSRDGKESSVKKRLWSQYDPCQSLSHHDSDQHTSLFKLPTNTEKKREKNTDTKKVPADRGRTRRK